MALNQARNAAEAADPWRWDKLRALYVPALGNTGDTLHDWAGRRLNGDLDASAVWAQTAEGPAVDPTAGGVALPGPLITGDTTAFTIAVSFYLDTLATADYLYDQQTSRIVLWNNNTQFKTHLLATEVGSSAHGLSTGDRVHLVWSVTCSPDTQRMWCNGVELMDDATAFTDWGAASGAAYIGARYDNTNLLPGKINFFAMYDRAWNHREAIEFHRDPYAMLRRRRVVTHPAITTHTTTKDVQADADMSGCSSVRSLITTGTVLVAAIAISQLPATTGTPTATATAEESTTQYIQPVEAEAVATGSSSTRDLIASGTCEATGEASGYSDYYSAARELWNIYHALDDAAMDFNHPIDSYTSLPHTTPAIFGAAGKHRVVVERVSAYGFRGHNRVEREFWVGDSGDGITGVAPSMPQFVSIAQADYLGTSFVVDALYDHRWDGDSAATGNGFTVYFTFDGSEPNPDTPQGTYVVHCAALFLPAVPPGGIPPGPYWMSNSTWAGGYPFGGLDDGTVVKMRCRVYREVDGVAMWSDLTPTVTVVLVSNGPAAPRLDKIDYWRQDEG